MNDVIIKRYNLICYDDIWQPIKREALDDIELQVIDTLALHGNYILQGHKFTVVKVEKDLDNEKYIFTSEPQCVEVIKRHIEVKEKFEEVKQPWYKRIFN